MSDESTYIVYWTENRETEHSVVEADTPEKAAEKAVEELVWGPEATAVEVGVAEVIFRRHDVILND